MPVQLPAPAPAPVTSIVEAPVAPVAAVPVVNLDGSDSEASTVKEGNSSPTSPHVCYLNGHVCCGSHFSTSLHQVFQVISDIQSHEPGVRHAFTPVNVHHEDEGAAEAPTEAADDVYMSFTHPGAPGQGGEQQAETDELSNTAFETANSEECVNHTRAPL